MGNGGGLLLSWAMPLFWIVHEIDGKPTVFIQDASTLLYARLAAARAGFDAPANFVEAHKLDSKMEKKVPKNMRGRALRPGEAKRLLERMA